VLASFLVPQAQVIERGEQAAAYQSLAGTLGLAGPLDEAGKVFDRAAREAEEGLRRRPGDRRVRELVGLAHLNRGMFYLRLGRVPEGKQAAGRARQLIAELAADYPGIPGFRAHLVAAHGNLGYFAFLEHDLEGARRAFEESLKIGRQLVGEFPSVPEYHHHLDGQHLLQPRPPARWPQAGSGQGSGLPPGHRALSEASRSVPRRARLPPGPGEKPHQPGEAAG
jgi:tetratricopeptide (TPR) repeat protein